MTHFTIIMHEIRFWLGLSPDTTGKLTVLTRSSYILGRRRAGDGKEGRGKGGGKGKEKGRERSG